MKLLNTKGAADWLGCTESWVHKLVYAGKLKAHVYDEGGTLIARPPGEKRQGQGLYFYERDLKAYKRGRRGRPKGARDRAPRKSPPSPPPAVE